jgi:hypothetical protein
MMTSPFRLLCWCGLLWGLIGCGPEIPDEATLRARLQGTYCDAEYHYLLKLEDSTYFNRRVFRSPLGVGRSYESCRGRYQLVFADEQWHIRFEKDPKPNAVENCDGEFVVWNEQEGYLFGNEEQIALPDCFDRVVLVKQSCD